MSIITGTSGNDTLQGTAGADELYASDGDDSLEGYGGDDVLDGGNGIYDRVVISNNSPGAVTVNLTTGTASGPDTGNDALVNIEIADVYGLYSATLTGSDGNNFLNADTGGPNVISGGGGDDSILDIDHFGGTLDGGSGIDQLQLGRDRLRTMSGYSTVTTSFIHTFSPGVSGTFADGTSYANFEYYYVYTGTGDSAITFDHPRLASLSSGAWQLNGWYGEGANDTATVDLSGYAGPLFMSAPETLGGSPFVQIIGGTGPSFPSFVSFTNIENFHVIAGSGDDILTGSAGQDVFTGGGGNDMLDGGAGNDTIRYSGLDGNYLIVALSNKTFRVQDIRPGSPDGTDLVTGVENIQWSDGSSSSALQTFYQPGDFNTDGLGDIVWQNNDGTAAIWTMNGVARIGGDELAPKPGSSWHLIGSGDFNADGRSDLLWQNNEGTAAVWFMNGATRLGGDTLPSNPGSAWHVKAAADFNGDAKADVLWQNNDGSVAVWIMNGTARLGAATVSSNPGPSWHVVGSGDFDGDTKADILFQNDDGRAAIWLMNSLALRQGAAVADNPGPAWHVKGSGDFDGDGKSDILWQNDDGRVAIWFINGTNMSSRAALSITPDPGWTVKGAEDLNGDRKADILWQNGMTGEAAVWFMNGTTKIGGDTLTPNSGISWHLIANAG